MGFYGNQEEKREAISKELNKIQIKIEEIQQIAFDKQYNDLVTPLADLYDMYERLRMSNEMGVGLK